MSQPFSFSFSGDDIEDSEPSTSTASTNHSTISTSQTATSHQPPETGSLARDSRTRTTAFPISGIPLLPATAHTISSLLATLPSSIAYGTLEVKLDDGTVVLIPRRELWDVRVQIMAEDGLTSVEGSDGTGKGIEGLGQDDVKTGVYEGGFKSWECSVDMVRVLAAERGKEEDKQSGGKKVLEMGCGTALPSLALLQWHLSAHLPPQSQSPSSSNHTTPSPLHLTLADYNPTVLTLVTLPNILLTWALTRHLLSTSDTDGEFDIDDATLASFRADLQSCNVELDFVSGAWSPQFVSLVTAPSPRVDDNGKKNESFNPEVNEEVLVLAAETIYSPFALRSFAEALMGILASENTAHHGRGVAKKNGETEGRKIRALVGAKKVYFGVGGSVEDFLVEVKGRGADVWTLREEEDGVRRAVVGVSIRVTPHLEI